MPRVTRAALRSNALAEESAIAASTPLPSTPIKERVPLGEIANVQGEGVSITAPEEPLEPGKKGPGKAKKGKVTKNVARKTSPRNAPVNVEVLEDDAQSTASSAVGEACEELMKKSSGEIHQIPMHDRRPRTPPSPAVNAIKSQLSPKVQTPRFDPMTHTAVETTMLATEHQEKDSVAAAIGSRTPVDMTSTKKVSDEPSTDVQTQGGDNNLKEDCVVEQVVTRSTGKPKLRIEDSVEALDAFEEAIEKVGEQIPAITENPQSPVPIKRQRKVPNMSLGGSTRKTAMGPKLAAVIGSVQPEAKNLSEESKENSRPPPAARSVQPMAKKPVVARPSVSKTSFTKLTKGSDISSTLVPTKDPLTTTRRVSSLQKAPFQPTKSTKLPTRASFELPGDAISRKLKEQREQRLKREQEEEAKKRNFKARPVRLSHAPVVKPTATSKARMSLAKIDTVAISTANDHAPSIKPKARPVSMATADANKRLSSIIVAKRSPAHSANNAASLTRKPSLTGSATSTTGLTRALVPAPAANGVRQTSRGKEVFGRNKVELEEREKQRKEKEEAARKARVEAADRGRVASREWAERQKARKLGVVFEGAKPVAV